jgi:hypothetical protein
LEEVLRFNKDLLDDEKMLLIYPMAIKRLDDSQDKNRIKICDVLGVWFDGLRDLSESVFEYIIKTAFIHLDDKNEEVRKAVFVLLNRIKERNRDVFKRVWEDYVKLFHNLELIKKLEIK